MNRPRQIFVNLPVRDLERSMAFFERLGFSFEPAYTDAKAACMKVNDDAFVMLLHDPFFRTFTRRDPCDTSHHTEVLLAVSCPDRESVDAMVRTAVEHGGAPAMDPLEYETMYAWSFYDPDGHHWEPLWSAPDGDAA